MTLQLFSAANKNFGLPRRVFLQRSIVMILLILTEMVLLSLRFDTGSENILTVPHPLYGLLYNAGKFAKILLATAGALIIFSLLRRESILALIDAFPQAMRAKHSYLLIHLLSMGGFYYLCQVLIEDIPNATPFNVLTVYLLGLLWLLAGLAIVSSALLWVAKKSLWQALIRSEYRTLLAAIGVGLFALVFGLLTAETWEPLAASTFYLASQLLRIFYHDIYFDSATFLLGAGNFSVTIAPTCSGYEGMGLITAFLCIYIWIFRSQLRFPQVFLLFPISLLAIWLLNVVRIVTLILIGDKLSASVAASGFHSSAGWIIFVLLSIAIIAISQKFTFFSKAEQQIAPVNHAVPQTANALLMPFIVLMASILLANALSSGFDWFYPGKVLVCVVTLWLLRREYRTFLQSLSMQAVLIGLGVFAIWLLLVPSLPSEDEKFANTLFVESPIKVQIWLFFRVMGAVITVPIIEELAFRGYLMAKLVDQHFEKVTVGKFTWLSFLGSSLLFGLMHGQWLAGFLAGAAYALAVYRRGALVDAVLAHMVTNLCLSIYVIYTGHWSLW